MEYFQFCHFQTIQIFHALRLLFGQNCETFHRFAVLWLHFDFLTMYVSPYRLNKTSISFYWFYVLSLTETCYKD